MKVKVKVLDGKAPSYAYSGDAGMDLYSADSCKIVPGEVKTIRTGVKVAIPLGYVGLVWDKSGIASKKWVKSMGGVVDSGYRGEVTVILANLGKEDFAVEKGMKVAQMLIQKVEQVDFEHVDELDETERKERGFGSSGR